MKPQSAYKTSKNKPVAYCVSTYIGENGSTKYSYQHRKTDIHF